MKGRRDNGIPDPRLNNTEVPRQQMPQQQIPTGPALIEGVERTNVMMVCPNQRAGFTQHNPYAIDVN